MLAPLVHRYLARQFARPRGLAGRLIFGAWLNRVNQGMNALALRTLQVRPSDHILEVGFGGGALFEAILDENPADAIGIDPSFQMVARARRRFRGPIRRGRADIQSGSVEALPVESRLIDKACSLNTIYFWSDPPGGMRELARVVRPGGTLVLGFEAPETLRAWPGHRHGFTVYSPDEVIALAAGAGFGNARVHEGVEPKYGKIYCLEFKRL